MKLPEGLKAKTVELIWDHDLAQFISDTFGRSFSVLDDGEYSQNELVTLEILKDPDATAKVQAWLNSPAPEHTWEHNPARPLTKEVLSELANRGILPEGYLHVNVWW